MSAPGDHGLRIGEPAFERGLTPNNVRVPEGGGIVEPGTEPAVLPKMPVEVRPSRSWLRAWQPVQTLFKDGLPADSIALHGHAGLRRLSPGRLHPLLDCLKIGVCELGIPVEDQILQWRHLAFARHPSDFLPSRLLLVR